MIMVMMIMMMMMMVWSGSNIDWGQLYSTAPEIASYSQTCRQAAYIGLLMNDNDDDDFDDNDKDEDNNEYWDNEDDNDNHHHHIDHRCSNDIVWKVHREGAEGKLYRCEDWFVEWLPQNVIQSSSSQTSCLKD